VGREAPGAVVQPAGLGAAFGVGHDGIEVAVPIDVPQRDRLAVAGAEGRGDRMGSEAAAAVARAAKLRGIPAYIVMPSNSSRAKIRAVEGYGGKLTFCEPTQAARESTCARIIKETGATLVHAFENENVMAGQGTAVLELLEDTTDLDLILCPVGGGGLLAGTAIAAKTLRPSIRIIATEPAEAADTERSFRAGRIVSLEKTTTVADGLRTTIGAPNFAITQRYVDDVVTVDDGALLGAMRILFDRMKLVVEPSGAITVAALLEGIMAPSGPTVAVLSGGNIEWSGVAALLAGP
jgi:threonine dehydratase